MSSLKSFPIVRWRCTEWEMYRPQLGWMERNTNKKSASYSVVLTHSDCKFVQPIRSILIQFLKECISCRLIEWWIDFRQLILIIFIGTQHECERSRWILPIEFRKFEAVWR